MADEKQAPKDDAQEKGRRHEDLELPDETAEQVKGGGYDIKKNQKV